MPGLRGGLRRVIVSPEVAVSQEDGDAGKIEIVGLCVRPLSEPAAEAAHALSGWLRERGVEVLMDADATGSRGETAHSREVITQKADLVIVLGGDGTLLSVAREAGARSVPILGVNLGTLGFLAEVNPEEQYALLEDILAGDYRTSQRMRLDVRAERGGRELLRALALNDAVLSRTDLSRMIDLETSADGVLVTRYHGDGLIVSTPTGSTAYTLSAGGPILLPGSRVYVLTPICPHTLTQRPLVLPADSRIEITVRGSEAAQLTVDGQVGEVLHDGDVVTVTADAPPAEFVVAPGRSRFDILRSKLGWGAG